MYAKLKFRCVPLHIKKALGFFRELITTTTTTTRVAFWDPSSWSKNEWRILTESVDAVSQRQQTAVDVSAFDHSLAAVLRVGGTLRAGKVDEEQLAYTQLLMNAGHSLTLLDGHNEYCVRPGWRLVGSCRLLSSLLVTALQHRHHLNTTSSPLSFGTSK